MHDLEDRLRVIIETAHQTRIAGERDLQRLQDTQQPVPVTAALLAEVIQGVGQLGIDSLSTNDFPAVMGVTVMAAVFIIVANLIVDVLYAFLDPRIRYS